MIPLILAAAALAAGGMGVAAGASGLSKMQEAEQIGKAAQAAYEKAQHTAKSKLKETQELAEAYGRLQLNVKIKTIGQFIQFLETIQQQCSKKELDFLYRLEGWSPEKIREYKATILEAQTYLKGGLSAASAAYATGSGTVGLVALFGTASTGTAIGTLSGAAAWNATLAWLGGGSLAAGGGGMALGTVVLGGVVVGPALMIGGFVLGGKGEEALTQAHDYSAKANVEIKEIGAYVDFLKQVDSLLQEFTALLSSMSARILESLSELKSQPFEIARDEKKIQQVMLLAKAANEVMATPILDKNGCLNPLSRKLKLHYGRVTSDSRLIIYCSSCSQRLRVGYSDFGLKITCPKCRHQFLYPSTSEK